MKKPNTPISAKELKIAKLRAHLERGQEDIRNGRFIEITTEEELDTFFKSLIYKQ